MNLLQLAHRLPWPPIDGGNKGVLGFVEAYSRHPAVSSQRFLCLCRLEDMHWVDQWHPQNVQVTALPVDARNTVPRLLANTLFSRLPFNMAKYQVPRFATAIRSAIGAARPDVVHFDGLHVAGYAPLVAALAPRALRVLRCHNAEYMILQRLAEAEANPLKRTLIELQARRVKAYECAMLDHFDLILAITDTDAARFRALNRGCDARLAILPAGANIPTTLPPEPAQTGNTVRLIHIAAMDWVPNQDGLRWLRDQVLPALDSARLDYHLDVVGKSMPGEFFGMNGPRVTVHGFVDDLTSLIRAAHIAVVPLRVGSGMRVKILDYWAMGIPIVATRVAAEGLFNGVSAEIALADEPADFARAIERLATNPPERLALRNAGFEKVSTGYGWPALVDKLINRYVELGAPPVANVG
jgi:glycosyltransferase involved in cell wall biosynthesis